MESWTWLGRADNIIGIAGAFLTVFFSGYAFVRLRQQNRRLRELAERAPKIENFKDRIAAHAGVKSSGPVAFALSLIPTSESINSSVKTFLRSKNWEMPIEELNMNGLNSDEDREEFINRLLAKKRYFEAQGFTEVHLFIAGPVLAGVLIGAMFDNWIPVKLYHKPQPPPPQIYEYWMPLMK